MDLYKPLSVKLHNLNLADNEKPVQLRDKRKLPLGCIGELFYLKHSGIIPGGSSTKMILSIGGWSNRDRFPGLVRDTRKFENFIDSAVETMFRYGFDGIDLDWEFPKDDGLEPNKYLEMISKLRRKMDDLELEIFGETKDHPKFQLSVATPAFIYKLSILPIIQMDQYVDYWNMMTYDYYGSWSEATGYHCNLFNGDGSEFRAGYKHEHTAHNNGLNANEAIDFMIKSCNVPSSKVVLGMAAYGREFKHVKSRQGVDTLINQKFKGVGKGGLGDEPGMWLYNQLPLKGTVEMYDPNYGAAFCYDKKSETFIGYDNVDSVKLKAQYVQTRELGGGFWWESCGDDHINKRRSLLYNFSNEVTEIRKFSDQDLIFRRKECIAYYLNRYGTDGFLSGILQTS